jgi:hypothetical protein
MAALGGGEEPAFALFGDARRLDVGTELLGQFMVEGDSVLLAAFLEQAQLPASQWNSMRMAASSCLTVGDAASPRNRST